MLNTSVSATEWRQKTYNPIGGNNSRLPQQPQQQPATRYSGIITTPKQPSLGNNHHHLAGTTTPSEATTTRAATTPRVDHESDPPRDSNNPQRGNHNLQQGNHNHHTQYPHPNNSPQQFPSISCNSLSGCCAHHGSHLRHSEFGQGNHGEP